MLHNYKIVHKHLTHRLIYLGKYWHFFSNNWQCLPRTQKKWENLEHFKEELAVNILILIYSVFPANHTKPIYMHTPSCGCRPCPHGLWTTRLLRPWDSPGKNTGVGCHSLLQRIFPTQESNPGLLHCRQILYCWATWEAQTHRKLGKQSLWESVSPEPSSPHPTPQLIHTVKMNVHSYTYKRKQMFFQSNQPYFLNTLHLTEILLLFIIPVFYT